MSRFGEMKALQDAGLTCLAIARKLHVTRGVVSGVLSRGEVTTRVMKPKKTQNVRGKWKSPSGEARLLTPHVPWNYEPAPITLPHVEWMSHERAN